MEELIFVKRTKKTENRRNNEKPTIKLEYPTGRFSINKKLAEVLGVGKDCGLMFGFNQKAKTGFVTKDDEPDAFIIRQKDQYSLGFTSKDLQDYFIETFGLLETGKSIFHFTVANTPNNKGLYSITLEG